MWRQALREIRQHPGRLVATLLAIALSVGFMSAVSIFMATQGAALGKMLALPTSKADVVVNVNRLKPDVTKDAFVAALKGAAGVEVAEPVVQGGFAVSNAGHDEFLSVYGVPSERFRWAKVSEGRWPAAASEIALSREAAARLQVKVGDTLQGGPVPLTLVGLTQDAPSMLGEPAYVDASLAESGDEVGRAWVIGVKPGTDPAAARDAVKSAIAPFAGERDTAPQAPEPLEVKTSEQAQHDAMTNAARGLDVLKYLLLAFTAIAALVGTIIIANTFTILLAQRRRQIGLLRAVGATGAQVRRRFLAEAVLFGLLGSLLGVALGGLVAFVGATVTKAAFFGLVLPWSDLAVEVAVGVVLTVLSAMLPALRATRVAPLEALRPVATSEQARRASRVRIVITGLLTAVGLALAAWAVTIPVDPKNPSFVGPLLLAVGAAMLVTLGVLGAAPLYVPLVIRGLGRLVGRAGPTARLAAANAVRNPTRAAATATALMLATGLIVTLQIGVATTDRTITAHIEKTRPIDVSVVANPYVLDAQQNPSEQAKLAAFDKIRLPEQTQKAAMTLPNAGASVTMRGTAATVDDFERIVMGLDPAFRDAFPAVDTSIGDGEIWVSGSESVGKPITITTAHGSKTLTVKEASWLGYNEALVSPATLAVLDPSPKPVAVYVRLVDKSQIATTMKSVETLQKSNPDGSAEAGSGFQVGGSASQIYIIKQILNVLLLITTALLGVAVAIALIGVGNTLGLSVIERTRESALLRALGMKRGSLRLMLLVEALLLCLTGVLVGVLAGLFFAWLGMTALLRQANIPATVMVGVDPAQTLGLIAIAVVAASLASVLPGRRAALASPVEALAVE